jgi:hypothetical protein
MAKVNSTLISDIENITNNCLNSFFYADSESVEVKLKGGVFHCKIRLSDPLAFSKLTALHLTLQSQMTFGEAMKGAH